MTKWSAPSSPSLWIATYLPSASQGETCLDVACGTGRHLQLAISRGYAATGIDRIATFPTDLVTAPGVKLLTWDLENGNPWPLRNQQFQAVIVTNYLYRPLLPTIVDSVAPDGILIYETFAAGHERFGRPSNPNFLLQPGELLEAVRGCLTPIAYQQTRLENPSRMVQQIAAVGPKHPWLTNPPPSSRA